MNNFYVYQYIDPRDNTPFYIGKGTGDRAWTHMKYERIRNENYFKKCKIEGLRAKGYEPIVEIVKSNLTETEAYDLEKTLIEQYGRKDLDEGGILTNRCLDMRPPRFEDFDKETRDRLRKQRSDIHRKLWSDPEYRVMMKKRRTFYTSDEYRALRSTIAKSNIVAIQEGLTKYRETEEYQEHLKRMSERFSGEGNPMYGKPCSEERRENIRKAHVESGQFKGAKNPNAKTYLITNPEGEEFTVHGGLQDFCEKHSLSHTAMYAKVSRNDTTPSKRGSNKGWSIAKVTNP